MDNDSHKDDKQLNAKLFVRMKENDKALFSQFAKDHNMPVAEFFRKAARKFMISEEYLTESPILGVSDKDLPYRIVRAPIILPDVFKRLISHLKDQGYVVWGKPFQDTAGYKMQFMVLNPQPPKGQEER
jgi:hypothetical protein